MNKHVTNTVLSIMLSFVFIVAHTQEEDTASSKPTTPRWASDKGYWVIKTNIKTPKSAIVYFYDNNNTLVYEEAVEGVKLNVRRARTKLKLTRAMEKAVLAYQQKQPLKQKDQLVAIAFR